MKKLLLFLSPLFILHVIINAYATGNDTLIILNQTNLWVATQIHPYAQCTSNPKEFCTTSLELAPHSKQSITSLSIVKSRDQALEFSIDANDAHIVTVDLKSVDGHIQCSKVYSSRRYKGQCIKTNQDNEGLCIFKRGETCHLPN